MRILIFLPLFYCIASFAAHPDAEAQLHEYLRPFDERVGPGVAVSVLEGKTVRFQRGYGLRDIVAGKKMNAHTRVELASVSKQLTAMAIMLLEETGLVAYDTPITRYLPELLPFAAKVTVRHLLQHTGGLPDYMELCRIGRPVTNADVLGLLARKQKLDFSPGEEYRYSNTGYAVLASVVERASGALYPDFMRARIFAPLSMAGSFVNGKASVDLDDVAFAYTAFPHFKPITDSEIVHCNTIYGDGSIFSSLEDMARWHRELDAPTLVRRETLAEAFLPGKLSGGAPVNYGFGWNLDSVQGKPAVSHGGYWGGFTNLTVRFSERNLNVTVLTNSDDGPTEEVIKKVVELYLP